MIGRSLALEDSMTQATRPPPAATAGKAVCTRFGQFELDEENATLTRDGQSIALPPTPFAVLCALVRRQGDLVTKNALLDEVWGHRFVTESVLKTVIGKLRTALQDDARQPRFIETVSRRGYRFIAPIAASAAERAQPASRAPVADDAAFIGRDQQLSQLHAAWERARAGQRSIVWLAGQPGIGKTTLMQRFTASLGDAAWVRGQCVEQYGSVEPYLPVLEALGPLCRRDPSIVPLLRSVAPTWLLQLPWLLAPEERDALRRELSGVGPERMLREMGELLDRYTADRALLLVTEDLHWSDRATLQLLNYIARRPGASRFMWLATFRLSEVVALDHPLNPLRRELRLHRLCEEIVLDPFSESEVERYVSRRAPAIAADEAFIRALHERTDGVPLFVAHILGDLLHASSAPGTHVSAAGQIAGMAVPENLAAIIDHYLDKLSSGHRDLLAVAAVCGIDFHADIVADVLESDVASVSGSCDALVREHLWLVPHRAQDGHEAADPAYSFKHALYHQIVYERTAAVARMQLHRKAGLALERHRAAGAPVTAAELAMHFDRGREPIAALHYYAEAAEAALLNFSPAEGMTLAERGLELIAQAPQSADRDALEMTLAILHGASAAHLLGVGADATKAAYERAHALLCALPHHRLRGVLLHGLALALFVRADYAEASALGHRCAGLAAERSDPVLLLGACTVHAQLDMLQGRPVEGREWAERGLGVIASLDVSREESYAPQVTLLGLLAIHLLHLGLVDTARNTVRRARACADDWGQPMTQSIAMWWDALIEVRLGDDARVAGLASAMEQLVEKHAFAQGRAACRWFHGWARARAGEPRQGYALIMDAYEENTRLGMRTGSSEVLGYASEALLLAGDLDGAQARLEQALEVTRTIEERVYLPQLFGLEAAIAHARGNEAGAEAALRRALEEARTQQARWLELAALTRLCGGKRATRKDRQALAKLIDELPEAADSGQVAKARTLLAKA